MSGSKGQPHRQAKGDRSQESQTGRAPRKGGFQSPRDAATAIVAGLPSVTYTDEQIVGLRALFNKNGGLPTSKG